MLRSYAHEGLIDWYFLRVFNDLFSLQISYSPAVSNFWRFFSIFNFICTSGWSCSTEVAETSARQRHGFDEAPRRAWVEAMRATETTRLKLVRRIFEKSCVKKMYVHFYMRFFRIIQYGFISNSFLPSSRFVSLAGLWLRVADLHGSFLFVNFLWQFILNIYIFIHLYIYIYIYIYWLVSHIFKYFCSCARSWAERFRKISCIYIYIYIYMHI